MNFSPVISWARSTSYDVVGILIPGYVALFLFTFFLLYLPGYSIVLDAAVDSKEVGKYSLGFQGNIIIVTLIAYLIGFSVKALGDSITRIERVNTAYLKKFYLFGRLSQRQNYSYDSEKLLPIAAGAINRYLSKNNEKTDYVPLDDGMWFGFYNFSQSILEINQYPTKAVTYQNRYELFKSLSIVFGIYGVLALVSIVFSLITLPFEIALDSVKQVLVSIVICVVLYFFSLQSRDLYLKFWCKLGDTLITSIIVVLERIEKNKNQPIAGN